MRWYESLRGAREIVRVRRQGRQLALGSLTAYALRGSGRCRVAVTVGKPVGPAVLRNLVRRRIKGALDGAPAPGRAARIVFVAKPAAARSSYGQLAADVAAALERLSAA